MKTKQLLLLIILATVGLSISFAHAQTDPAIPITSEDSGRVAILTLLAQHTSTITEIGFTPRGTAFYSAAFDGQYCVWNVDTRRDPLGALYFCVTDYNVGASSFAWSLDEKALAVTGDNGTSIRIFRVYQPIDADGWNTPVLTIPNAEGAVVLSMQFTAGGLLAADTFDYFTFYNVRSGESLNTFEAIEAIVSPDGTRIALIDFDGAVLLIDGTSGEVIETLPTEGAYLAAFSPDGSWLATVSDAGTDWWQLEDEGYTRRGEIDRYPQQIGFSPDGRFVVTWEDESVLLWNLNSGQLAGELPEHDGGVSSAQFTPDMTHAVTIDTFGNGRIWRINEDGSAERLLLMRDRVDRAYLSPDSTTAIMARIEFFARFYDIQRGQLRGQYTMSPDSELSPDWTVMATITNNIVTWHALPNDPRPLAFPPVAIVRDAVNVRQTPSTEFARIAIIPTGDPVFALGRTGDNQWLRVVLPDGTLGWVFVSTSLQLQGDLNNLLVIEVG